MEIIPAIMPKNFEDLRAHVARVESFVESVQIDVMDGHFVPSVDWPYTEDTERVFSEMAEGTISLTAVSEVGFEIDLMVEDPLLHAHDWLSAGARRLIFHIEALEDVEVLLDQLPRAGYEIGLALNPDTPNERVAPYIHAIDFVQCMGISKIGYQGQDFDERVVDKLHSFRAQFPDVVLSVDGGVSLQTAPRLIAAGANRLVAGSAIWESDDIIQMIRQFEQLTS